MQEGINLSVLMTAHNSSRTIGKAISTALRGMPSDSELLVMLDACTDDTKQVVSKFADKRIRVFESADNLGVSSARNRLARLARGKYLAISDSDDIYLPWRYRSALRVLEARNLDFVFQNALIYINGFVVPQPPRGLSSAEANTELCISNPFVHSSATFRRAAFEDLGGYKETASEDYDLWLRASQAGFKLERLSIYGLLYRMHERQITKTATWRKKLRESDDLRAQLDAQKRFVGIGVSKLGKGPYETVLAARMRNPFRRLASKVARVLGLNSPEND